VPKMNEIYNLFIFWSINKTTIGTSNAPTVKGSVEMSRGYFDNVIV
jgi:hypothetical protein